MPKFKVDERVWVYDRRYATIIEIKEIKEIEEIEDSIGGVLMR